jgi:hypothetical protein
MRRHRPVEGALNRAAAIRVQPVEAVTVDPVLWQHARVVVEAGDGDLRRIRIISATEVEVRNRP